MMPPTARSVYCSQPAELRGFSDFSWRGKVDAPFHTCHLKLTESMSSEGFEVCVKGVCCWGDSPLRWPVNQAQCRGQSRWMFEDTEDTFPHCLFPQKTNHCLTGLDQYIFSTSSSNLINPNQPTGSAHPCVRISWKFFSNQLLLLFCLIHPDFISVWCCCCCCCNICRRITIINPAFQTLLVDLTKRAIHRDEFFLCSTLYRGPWRLQRWSGCLLCPQGVHRWSYQGDRKAR